MDIQIKKIRAQELVGFLKGKCGPSEITDIKSYSKIQRFRISLEKGISDFKEKYDDFRKRIEVEMAPFQQELQMLRFSPEQLKKRQEEIDLYIDQILKEEKEALDRFVKDHGDEVVQITVNEEDLNQVRLYFEKIEKIEDKELTKGATFWISPDAYLEVAEILGCIN